MSQRLPALLGLLLTSCGAPAREAARPAASPAPVGEAAPEHYHGHHPHHPPEGVPASSPAEQHGEQPPTATHRFDDPERWSRIFDDPARDAWQRPKDVVERLALAPDDVVVDLGTGTGYFVPYLSRAVPRGRVIAVDVEPELLRFVERRVARDGLQNVVTRLADHDDAKLGERVDVVLVVDAYHHIGQRTGYFKRLSRRLSERGRVVVVDFKLGDFPVGPPDSHKLAPEIVEREFAAGGFSRCSGWDGLPYQYFLVFALRCQPS